MKNNFVRQCTIHRAAINKKRHSALVYNHNTGAFLCINANMSRYVVNNSVFKVELVHQNFDK